MAGHLFSRGQRGRGKMSAFGSLRDVFPSRWPLSAKLQARSGSCKQKPLSRAGTLLGTAAYHSASDALLERAPPFTWLPEVCAILYAFSQPIKQVRSALCLPGCIHRCPPSVIHCAPSHYSFVAPYLPNPRISAGGANVPFLKRHVSRIAEAPFLVPLFLHGTERYGILLIICLCSRTWPDTT